MMETAQEPRVIVVTGGGKGVGRGISESFLRRGDIVVACGRSKPEALPRSSGNEAVFLEVDVRDATQIGSFVSEVVARYGRVDVLVNNAGGAPFAMAAAVSPRFHESIVKLNLLAPLWLACSANEIMQAQDKGGVIIFIASVSGIRASPGTASYGAAKAGVVSLVQTLAVEWAPRVRVAAVTPGPVLTEQAHLHYGDQSGIDAIARGIPLGRLASTEDVGESCIFLASDAASYISGTNVLLHGGGESPAFLEAATVNQDRRSQK